VFDLFVDYFIRLVKCF